MRRVLPLLLLVLGTASLPAGPVRAGDDPYDRVLERFRERVGRASPEHRVEAILTLDPNHPRSLPELLALLADGHWFIRGAAAEVLAKTTEPALRAELRLKLLVDENPLVRDGIALAFALSAEKGDAEALSESLTDGAWEVRRMSAIALRGIVSKESIAALIAALRKESDVRVALHIAETLRKLTGRSFGRDAEAWAKFWEQHKDDPALEGLEEESKTRPLGGIPLETVTVAPRAPPPGEKPEEVLDFLVLPPFGWKHDVYRPYLDDLSKHGRVTYVNLPPVQELTGMSGYGDAIPTYPVKRLVKALEELRAELGKGRVVILGEGASAWIGLAYAATYPKRTAGVILLNGFLDVKSYAAALGRLTRSPSATERWLAMTLTNQNSVPHDRLAYEQISRIELTMDLADPTDSRAYLLWRHARDPQGFAKVPALNFPERAEFETPALFFFGAKSRLTGWPDHERIRKHFPNSILANLLKSAGFGYETEYEEFHRVVEGFLKHYGTR